MNVGYVINDIVTALKGVFEFNKMSADKQYSLLTGTLINEVSVARKVYLERAEINRVYKYIPSVAQLFAYPLDPLTLKVFSVDYIINTTINPMKKIFQEDKPVAQTIGNDGILPSFYDDFTIPLTLNVYPSPDVTGASFQVYYQKQILDIPQDNTTDATDLLIPDRCYDDFRDYLIYRHLIMYGFMTADKVNMMNQLSSLKASFLASADKYKRYKLFDNPDIQPVVDGSM